MKKIINKKGFTLLELLVVISIIAILIAMGTVSYSAAQKKSRDSRRKSDMKTIQNAFEQYYSVNNGSYPDSCPGEGGSLPIGTDTFIIPKDPKGDTEYFYTPMFCDTSGYCYCAHLETLGTGNSDVNNCTGIGNAGDYFCAKNLQ